MAIKNGELIDADELANAYGYIFADVAQNLFNADYIGFDSRLYNTGAPNLKNVFYSTFTSDDGDTGTTMKYDGTSDFYIAMGDAIDNCDDSTVDTDLWSKSGSGTLAENTSYLTTGNITGTGSPNTSTILLDQTNAPNLKDGDSSIYTHTNFAVVSAGNGGKTFAIQLSDGTNTVSLVSYSAVGTSSTGGSHIYRFDIDVSAESVAVYIDGTFSSNVDVSSLTGANWNLRWNTTNEGAPDPTTAILIYYVYQINDSTTATSDYISSDSTSSETITNAILISNTDESTNATATYYLSADGGSNYEEVTPNEIHRFTNTGTTLKLKITADPNKQTDSFDYYYLTEFAVKYNLY